MKYLQVRNFHMLENFQTNSVVLNCIKTPPFPDQLVVNRLYTEDANMHPWCVNATGSPVPIECTAQYRQRRRL